MAIWRGVICIAIFLSSCLLLEATAIEKLSLQTLTQKSDLIAIVRIVNVETVLENGEPWTVATAALEKQMKGERRSTVQFRMPGGSQQIGGRTLVTQVEGSPLPAINERAVLFLGGRDKDRLNLTGLGRGYWRIQIEDGKEVAKPFEGPESSPVSLFNLVSTVQRAVREKQVQ